MDVGAGTGKLTRALLAHGHRVVAVEPSADMRATLTRSVPGLRVVAGTGEDTGLAAGCADAVTYAQAWHWTDAEAAGREAARLLRAGGTLGMVWNMFDTETAWMTDLERAMHASLRAWRPEPAGGVAALAPAGPFGPRHREVVRWTDVVPLADLRLQVRTRSYYLEGTPQERAQIDDAVAQAISVHFPGAAQDTDVEVPYVATVDRYERA